MNRIATPRIDGAELDHFTQAVPALCIVGPRWRQMVGTLAGAAFMSGFEVTETAADTVQAQSSIHRAAMNVRLASCAEAGVCGVGDLPPHQRPDPTLLILHAESLEDDQVTADVAEIVRRGVPAWVFVALVSPYGVPPWLDGAVQVIG